MNRRKAFFAALLTLSMPLAIAACGKNNDVKEYDAVETKKTINKEEACQGTWVNEDGYILILNFDGFYYTMKDPSKCVGYGKYLKFDDTYAISYKDKWYNIKVRKNGSIKLIPREKSEEAEKGELSQLIFKRDDNKTFVATDPNELQGLWLDEETGNVIKIDNKTNTFTYIISEKIDDDEMDGEDSRKIKTIEASSSMEDNYDGKGCRVLIDGITTYIVVADNQSITLCQEEIEEEEEDEDEMASSRLKKTLDEDDDQPNNFDKLQGKYKRVSLQPENDIISPEDQAEEATTESEEKEKPAEEMTTEDITEDNQDSIELDEENKLEGDNVEYVNTWKYDDYDTWITITDDNICQFYTKDDDEIVENNSYEYEIIDDHLIIYNSNQEEMLELQMKKNGTLRDGDGNTLSVSDPPTDDM